MRCRSFGSERTCFVSASVQKHLRGLEKPSDHVPVTVELSDG